MCCRFVLPILEGKRRQLMKRVYRIVIMTFSFFAAACDPQQKIIGTWVSTDDVFACTGHAVVFLEDGRMFCVEQVSDCSVNCTASGRYTVTEDVLCVADASGDEVCQSYNDSTAYNGPPKFSIGGEAHERQAIRLHKEYHGCDTVLRDRSDPCQ